MKKTLTTFFVSTVLVFGLVSPVFATTPTFDVYISNQSKATGVSRSREVMITYSVKDFSNFANQTDDGKDGINVFRATLEYDEDVFETIEVNDFVQGVFNGFETQTTDGRDPIEGVGNWDSVTYNPATKRIVTQVSQPGKFINIEDEVLIVTLKVKSTAAIGDTTVKLKSIEGTDQVKDVYTSQGQNAEIITTVKVFPSISPFIPDPNDPNHGWHRIMPDITVQEFKDDAEAEEYFESGGQLKNHQGTLLADDDYIPTGSSIEVGDMKIDIITVGDVNQDGRATPVDLSQFKAFFNGSLGEISDSRNMSCDVKWDIDLNTTDNSLLKSLLVGVLDPNIYDWKGSGERKCDIISGEYQ